MPKLKDCSDCGRAFDPRSPKKIRVGGLVHHCPDCSQETEVKVLGIQASAGKMAGVEILRFETQEDRDKYKRYWSVASGMHKGKDCQMHNGQTVPGIKFKKVYENHANPNHKGKT